MKEKPLLHVHIYFDSKSVCKFVAGFNFNFVHRNLQTVGKLE